jgi:hypothetical protein
MAVFQEKCWPCGKQCINAEFCGIDETYQLPRNIKVKVIANSEFWGFGGTVIEGYAHFDNSHYDFFDGFDEHHKELDCNGNGPYRNESRPDINYRSVYDPDSATVVHYGAGGSEDGIDRGGAEVYLVDRVSQNATDSSACSTTPPTQVFKWYPEKFGFGTKIHFHNNIYKNITGGWRLIDATGCYNNHFTTPGGSGAYLHQCTGIDKQNIRIREHSEGTYLQYHEPSRIRPIQDGMTFHDCVADGQIAPEYSGQLTELVRDTGDPTTSFLVATLNYGGVAASGLRNAMEILVTNGVDTTYDKPYRIFDVTHGSSSTDVSLVGTYDTENAVNINTGGSGNWIAFGTHDPSRCCGGSAYGIDNLLKSTDSRTNYHTDFRRVFNNAKNLRQSNRVLANRKNHNINVVFRADETGVRPDRTYPSTDADGNPTLVFDRGLPYYGPFHRVDQYDGETRFDQVKNAIRARNATCYSKKGILEIFPDCITQENKYQNCASQDEYIINRLPRLTFVYRGCNYDEACSFDASGRPLGDPGIYGGWTSSGPASLQDIKRGLPGQEITMFLNVGDAWGGEYKRCPCCCIPGCPPGSFPPQHVTVESPITFPCFPDFDKYPVANGCREKRFQFSQYARYVEEVAGSTLSHEACDEIPGVDAACNVRQPYTTYGHISHLCGREGRNSKTILTNAFAKQRQDGSYTHRTPDSGNIDEPMYWGFECPAPHQSGTPLAVNWASGAAGDNAFSNVPGQFYPYWGLTDGEGRLTTPHFNGILRTIPGCCGGDAAITYVDYDHVYTFFNGWPTSGVPFLIELETTDNCVGCATTVMETGALTLNFEGLNASFLHDVSTNVGTDAYGFHHCKYRGTKLEPGFNCQTGFATQYCTDNADLNDKYWLKYGVAETGDTCECMDGYDIRLTPVTIDGSDDIIIGWRTVGSGNGFVEITDCNNGDSKVLETDYRNLPGAGYTAYGKFTVACEENVDYVDPPKFPNAYYETSVVNNLYSCGGCTHKEPAQIAGVGNLTLKAEFFIISNLNKDIFEALPEHYFGTQGVNDFLDWPEYSGINANLTLCSGDAILQYGCLLNTFYGCSGNTNACLGNTLCSTCPVECACGTDETFVQYTDPDTGFVGKRYPREFNLFPDCFCECKDPTLMRILAVSGDSPTTTFTETWRHSAACDQSISNHAPWFAVSGVSGDITPPILIGAGPPAPYLGMNLGTFYSQDWFSYSHGINKLATGISYRLDEPSLDDCLNLDPATCTTGNCIDGQKRARSVSCLDPIAYNTGVAPYGRPEDSWLYGDANVTVNKKYCYPEIMVVSKIECLPENSGYDLTVSREYHEHDRTWRQGGSTDCRCVEKYAGVYTCPQLVPVSSGTGASGEFTIDAGGTGHFTVTSSGQDYVFGGTAVIPTCVNGATTRPCCTGTPTPAFTATFGGANNSLTGASISPPTGYMPTGEILLHTNKPSSCGSGPFYNIDYTGVVTNVVSGDFAYVDHMSNTGNVLISTYKYKVTNIIDSDSLTLQYVSDTAGSGNASPCDLCDGNGSSASCDGNPVHTFKGQLRCDVVIIPGTSGVVDGTGCTTMPYAVPADSVTPAYQGPCSIHPSSGTYVNQDFRITGTCEGADWVWNYYNLFYSGDSVGVPPVVGAADTYPSGKYYGSVFVETDSRSIDGCGPVCDRIISNPVLDPLLPHTIFDQALFNTPSGRLGIDATNRKHSCVQDVTTCGGELWCNKLFFPRRSYKSGTKIAPFGSSQICTQNAKFLNRTSLGYGDIPNADILKESTFYRYIDLCDPDIIATAQSGVGIDDIVIRVDDYLRLMGVVHPGWRYNLNMKSCTILETGNCGGTLPPTHSDLTIHSAVHQPKTWDEDDWESFGYYLDKDGVSDPNNSGVGASGYDNCLFDPFKIMVDVECSTNHIKRRGIETDDPTLLDAIIDMPAAACKGTVNPPPCSCIDSNCNSWNQRRHDFCLEHWGINAYYATLDGALICPCNPAISDEIALPDNVNAHLCSGATDTCETGVFLCPNAAAGDAPVVFEAFSQWLFNKYVMASGDFGSSTHLPPKSLLPQRLNPFTPILDFTGVATNIGGTNYTYKALNDEGLLRLSCNHETVDCGGSGTITDSGFAICRGGSDDFDDVYVWCENKDIIVGRTGPFQLPIFVCSGDFGAGPTQRWLADATYIADPTGCCRTIDDNNSVCATDIYALEPGIDCNSSMTDPVRGGMVVLDNWSGIVAAGITNAWSSGCGCDFTEIADIECGTDSKVRVTITQTPVYSGVVCQSPGGGPISCP